MKRRETTTTEAELRELVSQGKTFVTIAAELRIDINALRATCSVLGIRSAYNGGRKDSSARANQYLEKLKTGATLDEVGCAFGITRQAVYRALKKASLPTTARAVLRWQSSQEPSHA
jgi:DNA-binding CsgD family transcriptional regulator